jgi:hypothetical protein
VGRQHRRRAFLDAFDRAPQRSAFRPHLPEDYDYPPFVRWDACLAILPNFSVKYAAKLFSITFPPTAILNFGGTNVVRQGKLPNENLED